MATPERLLGALHDVPDDVERLMIIGHNPSLERFARSLAGPESKKKPMRRLAKIFPTATLAIIEFDTDSWARVVVGAGRLVRFVRPKDLT